MKKNSSVRTYRYGDKPTWEIVFDAVRDLARELHRPVTHTEVGNYIVSRIPDFKRTNLGPNLSVLSVNCYSRGNHGVNRNPRKTNSGNKYDRLIRIGEDRNVRFTVYDPQVHGVWELAKLADVNDKVLRPSFVCSGDSLALAEARADVASCGLFDPHLDARRRILGAIVQRDGQGQFRGELLKAYSSQCAVTGCTIESLLEAAHIVPYRGEHTNVVENGLLLRADLHKLFDLHMLRIDAQTRTIHLCEELKKSEYGQFDGIHLREPNEPRLRPLKEALEDHEQYCTWAFLESK